MSYRNILLTLTLLLAAVFLPAERATADTLPTDTAYVTPLGYSNNRADSITVAGRTFTGSGPFTVYFEAEAPETATYVCWEIASDASFTDLLNRYYETHISYEFADAGTFYARFTTANAAGEEETYGEPYTITITESLLLIPNLITPDSPTGSNTVFKVKYRSLRRFEMWVYNRWGNQLFHSTNPDDGWDGTAGGKTVPTGAYYYLIKAEGTDGIKYQKKGDINVLRTRERNTNSGVDY
jgi:gliding motility-associated-like protein